MLFVVCPLLLLIFGFLCLIFVNLINMCLGVFCLGFTLFGILLVSWIWVIISFPILRKFSIIISSSIFSWSCFFSSYDLNVGAFNIVPEVSDVGLISFNSFSLFQLCFIFFYHSIFYLTFPIFCLCYSTVGSLQGVFLISFIALFIIH